MALSALETIVAVLQSGVFCLLSGFYITEVLRRKDPLASALSIFNYQLHKSNIKNFQFFFSIFFFNFFIFNFLFFLKESMKDTSNKWHTFFIRWFCSTNAKDIGMLYLIFARWSGVIATTMSL